MSEDFISKVEIAVRDVALEYRKRLSEKQRFDHEVSIYGDMVVNGWRTQTFVALVHLINADLRKNGISLLLGFGAYNLRGEDELAFLEFTLSAQQFGFQPYAPLRLEVHEDGYVRSSSSYPYTAIALKISEVDQAIMLNTLCQYIAETLATLI